MHIAWIGKKSPFCGNVTYSLEITKGLIDRGHRVSFIHFNTGNRHTWTSGDRGAGRTITHPSASLATHHPSDCLSPKTFPNWDCEISLPYLYKSQILTIHTPKASKVLRDALTQLQPDLVHASLTLSPLDFSIPDLCNELEIPAVATFHPPFDRHQHNFASRTQHLLYKMYAPSLRNYHRTIIFSELQKRILAGMGVPTERIAVIPNGVDVEKLSPGASDIKERLGAERLFVYQGRISPEKNVEALLKAWKRSRMAVGSKLAIVGDGPLMHSLKPYFRSEHGIEWLGYVADERERIEILRGADAFVLPSLVEGLSLSLLEAMACGVAVVATDVGADGEAIDGGAGIAIASDKVTQELTTLLPLLQNQREFTQLLGVKARQRVLERYTLNRNLDLLNSLYAELVESDSMAPQPQAV